MYLAQTRVAGISVCEIGWVLRARGLQGSEVRRWSLQELLYLSSLATSHGSGHRLGPSVHPDQRLLEVFRAVGNAKEYLMVDWCIFRFVVVWVVCGHCSHS